MHLGEIVYAFRRGCILVRGNRRELDDCFFVCGGTSDFIEPEVAILDATKTKSNLLLLDSGNPMSEKQFKLLMLQPRWVQKCEPGGKVLRLDKCRALPCQVCVGNTGSAGTSRTF